MLAKKCGILSKQPSPSKSFLLASFSFRPMTQLPHRYLLRLLSSLYGSNLNGATLPWCLMGRSSLHCSPIKVYKPSPSPSPVLPSPLPRAAALRFLLLQAATETIASSVQARLRSGHPLHHPRAPSAPPEPVPKAPSSSTSTT
jgi:hypothetical protein